MSDPYLVLDTSRDIKGNCCWLTCNGMEEDPWPTADLYEAFHFTKQAAEEREVGDARYRAIPLREAELMSMAVVTLAMMRRWRT